MPFFTVFTATFNRGYILPKLYDSLKKQEIMDFEWLVIDDGSSDETEQLFQQWIHDEIMFPIRYMKKDNGGKPRTINYGIQYAKGEYFFMVDSDDTLKPDALSKMKQWCKEIESKPQFIGVGAARGFPDGSYIKGIAPSVNEYGYIDASNLQRNDFNLDADMCEAYKTEIFKKYPMPEWPGEKFAPEQISLNEIALDGYLLRWHADIIYQCEYLDDGLTKRSNVLEKKNPMGYAMMYNHMLKYPELSIKQKYYAACQHIALSIYGKNSSYILRSNKIIYSIFALPVGILLSIRRRKQFDEVNE
jgi:glycosyltransferase involved in cell wall biosynthesis